MELLFPGPRFTDIVNSYQLRRGTIGISGRLFSGVELSCGNEQTNNEKLRNCSLVKVDTT